VGELLKYKLLIVMGICLALLLVTTVNANPLDDLFNLLFGGVTQKQDAQEAIAFTENSGTTIIRSR